MSDTVADRLSDEDLRLTVDCAVEDKRKPLYDSLQTAVRMDRVLGAMQREARRHHESCSTYEEWARLVIDPVLGHEDGPPATEVMKESTREAMALLRAGDFATLVWFEKCVTPKLDIREEDVTNDG